MRDVDGIEEVVATLNPHWEEVESYFNSENEKYKKLLETNHEPIGKILKLHLIIESYLTNFLEEFYKLDDIGNAELTFFQKTQLIPDIGSSATFVKNGIIELNKIRNKFAHKLDFPVDGFIVKEMEKVLAVARAGIVFKDNIEKIEAFTNIATAFLVLSPPHIGSLLIEAFKNIKLNKHIAE